MGKATKRFGRGLGVGGWLNKVQRVPKWDCMIYNSSLSCRASSWSKLKWRPGCVSIKHISNCISNFNFCYYFVPFNWRQLCLFFQNQHELNRLRQMKDWNSCILYYSRNAKWKGTLSPPGHFTSHHMAESSLIGILHNIIVEQFWSKPCRNIGRDFISSLLLETDQIWVTTKMSLFSLW